MGAFTQVYKVTTSAVGRFAHYIAELKNQKAWAQILLDNLFNSSEQARYFIGCDRSVRMVKAPGAVKPE